MKDCLVIFTGIGDFSSSKPPARESSHPRPYSVLYSVVRSLEIQTDPTGDDVGLPGKRPILFGPGQS